jgi:uncharacterized protein (DUF1501 family)
MVKRFRIPGVLGARIDMELAPTRLRFAVDLEPAERVTVGGVTLAASRVLAQVLAVEQARTTAALASAETRRADADKRAEEAHQAAARERTRADALEEDLRRARAEVAQAVRRTEEVRERAQDEARALRDALLRQASQAEDLDPRWRGPGGHA